MLIRNKYFTIMTAQASTGTSIIARHGSLDGYFMGATSADSMYDSAQFFLSVDP